MAPRLEQWESSDDNGSHAVLLDRADRQVWLLAIFDRGGDRQLSTALTRADMIALQDFVSRELTP